MKQLTEERERELESEKTLLMLAKGSFGTAYLLLYATCHMPRAQHILTPIRVNQRRTRIGATSNGDNFHLKSLSFRHQFRVRFVCKCVCCELHSKRQVTLVNLLWKTEVLFISLFYTFHFSPTDACDVPPPHMYDVH